MASVSCLRSACQLASLSSSSIARASTRKSVISIEHVRWLPPLLHQQLSNAGVLTGIRQTFPCGRVAGTTRIAQVCRAVATEAPAQASEFLSKTEQEFEGEQLLHSEVYKTGDGYTVLIRQPLQGATLHWGVNNWSLAPQEIWPEGTVQIDDKAVQSPFPSEPRDGAYELQLTMPESAAPRAIQFVLKDGDKWYNGPFAGNFVVQIKQPGVADIVDQAIEAEANYSNWSLFQRFIMARDLLDPAEQAGPSGMAFIYVWLRLSANRQLDWYRNSNYQSKDIAHVQKVLAEGMHDKSRFAMDPAVRRFARMAMGTLPRGGGDSEQIRMGILHIMREHGIREGHRPGIEEKFLEQWHQKLHTNTTPEDITICEAYLAYLHTANHDDYFRVLWDNGKISKEQLEKMDHPISSWPMHLPHLIPAFQHFLWILKTVHAGANMDTMVEMSKGQLSDDLKGDLYGILGDREAWWVPGKLVEAREKLEGVWRADWAGRDTLLLDIALDNYFGLRMAAVDKSSLGGDDLIELVALMLRNANIGNESAELAVCRDLWFKIKDQERWGKDWSLLAKAALDRVSLGLENYMDEIYNLVQPHAELFGAKAKVNRAYVTNFGEEVVRAQSLFPLSILVQKLEPMLRAAAGLGSWQVVSQAAAEGTVMVLTSLAEIQGEQYVKPRIVVAEQVGGMEDIPEGVVAVLSASATDVLSHVAIRARNQGCLLATAFDADELEQIRTLDGKFVSATVDAKGSVIVSEAKASSNGAVAKRAASSWRSSTPAEPPQPPKAWAISESDFPSGGVNQKSLNIARLREAAKNPSFDLPTSVALPFGAFEKALAASINRTPANRVKRLLTAVESFEGRGIPAELSELRMVVSTQLSALATLRKEVTGVAEAAGIVESGAWASDEAWKAAWGAICRVWASKWTDRAWLSRRAWGTPDGALQMAVLLQKVVPAEYAFVIHTADPISGDRSKIFGEVVPGLGEVLVGSYPGRAFSFTYNQDGTSEILSLPSKRIALLAANNSIIARSDSNGEDQEGFAGAGLYDSVPVPEAEVHLLDYTTEKLLWDPEFQSQLIEGVVGIAKEVEAAFGGVPQDIEGVYADGKFTVVQSRPQIL
ncbi:Carbohydrate-Binding Module Family 45 protein [Klebsormidium nitens]|uniref:Carbohydrate-Binding Module Family 45 protein n=1 Tax=Klebsormidium nitens TaxID=105231 RepID=A0A1Y1IP88_KLENI|nr:Carbohydrate-Binding Module Family 45 protein [Klebsormidium nitens]|eukprot:GAQ90596.1 Carbohydrate-Binding Module Family 45 protein [Klebsormidium nitens]